LNLPRPGLGLFQDLMQVGSKTGQFQFDTLYSG